MTTDAPRIVKDTYIYIMRADTRHFDVMKVGISRNPKMRRQTARYEFSIGHGRNLEIGTLRILYYSWCLRREDAFEIEQELHVRLKPWRLFGEWFKLADGCPCPGRVYGMMWNLY